MNASTNSPLRLLIVSPCFGVYGGIEAFVLAVATHVHRQPGFSVRICWKKTKQFGLTPFMKRRCDESGVECVFVERGSWDLYREIRSADIVHLQNASPDVVLMARWLKKPLVLTIHNYARSFSPRAWVWRAASLLADRRWYNSNFVWGTWERWWKLPASRRVPTISGMEADPAPLQGRKGFCFISRWIPNKGIDILVRAYAAAKLDPEKWPLRLMGDGPLRRSIEQIIAHEHIQGIELLGYVTEEQKKEIFSHAKWLLAPANTREDLGLTPIEARTMAIPAIVTRDGGLPESAGEAGILCMPGDIDDLARALREAAEMPESEYERRSKLANTSLHEFLFPNSFYTDSYAELTRRP